MQGLFRLESGLFTAPRTSNVAESARGPGVVEGRICVLGVSGFGRTLTGPAVHEPRDGRSQVGFSGIPEFSDERMPFERLLHDASLNALAAAVNQPHLTQPGVVRRSDVLLHDRRDVSRRERVQVEVVFDRDTVGHPATAIVPADRTR